jgi:hypothetical protein
VWQLLPGAARVEVVAQRCKDERLDLGGGNAADRSGRRGLALQRGLGHVIAVAGAALVGVGWAHLVAAIVGKAAGEERGRALAVIVANEHRAGFELAPGRAAVARQTLQE